MKTTWKLWSESFRRSTAAIILTAILTLPLTAIAQETSKQRVQNVKTSELNVKSLSEDQKILHVLNRLGFGARPGEIEKIKQIGLQRFVELQLNPEKIDDSVLEARLNSFDALKLTNAELFAKYPNPGGVVMLLAKRNNLNARQLRGDLKADKKAEKAGITGQATTEDKTLNNAPATNSNADAAAEPLSDEQKREYQRQLAELYRQYGFRRPAEITQQLFAARILRAVYSERQLQEQMVDFWSNHFNVYAQKGAVRWFLPEYDRDVVRPNALGNFRDLLVATAKSPAMLFYLDNFQSVAPKNNQTNGRLTLMMESGKIPPRMRERLKNRGLTDEQIEQRAQTMQSQQRRTRGINENYARELMELHTLGVNGGYTQKDVQEIARCFTGWTIVDPRGYRRSLDKLLSEQENKGLNTVQKLAGVPAGAQSGTFYFNARQHDDGEKTVLGQKIPAGGRMEDGLKAIDILVQQPSTARFIARKLVVKFVNDNPSEALVARVAEAFQKSNGDIKTTLRAVFDSPEFFAPENYRAKIKKPFEVLTSAIRTLGAETNAGPVLQALLAKMGEPLYGFIAPTGYPDKAGDWVNTGALLERLNFALALAANRVPGTRVDLTRLAGRNLNDKEQVMNAFIAVILNNEISPNTKQILLKQLVEPLPKPKLATEKVEDELMKTIAMQEPNNLGGKKRGGETVANRLLPPSGNAEVVKIVGLIIGSPEFQRQ